MTASAVVLILSLIAGLPLRVGAASELSSSHVPAVTAQPPQDPLMPDDISAWTYTPEFAARFKKPVQSASGPTGAYAVNFQVHQVEQLDRCVFNVFLDNRLPIDYPEGPVGFLPFMYPMSWAFLKLSEADRQAVDAAYLAKYREHRAVLTHGGSREALTWFQYRVALYPGVAVVSLIVNCDRVANLQNPMTLQLATSRGDVYSVALPDHWLAWIHSTRQQWRRQQAKPEAEGLDDLNVWSYTAEFQKRFGLGPLDEPAPVGAEAVAYRVERYHKNEQMCLLDLYLKDPIPLVLPESDHGFAGPRPGLGYFLAPGNKDDSIDWYHHYGIHGNTELFVIREIADRDLKSFSRKQHLKGNTYRVGVTSPLRFAQYRKHAVPGLSFLSLMIGCMEPPSGKLGPVGVGIARTDGRKHDITLPVTFLQRVHQKWRNLVDIPIRCKFPKLYTTEDCQPTTN